MFLFTACASLSEVSSENVRRIPEIHLHTSSASKLETFLTEINRRKLSQVSIHLESNDVKSENNRVMFTLLAWSRWFSHVENGRYRRVLVLAPASRELEASAPKVSVQPQVSGPSIFQTHQVTNIRDVVVQKIKMIGEGKANGRSFQVSARTSLVRD